MRARLGAGAVFMFVMSAAGAASVLATSATHGEQVYLRCQACHALAYDRVGPRHCGVVGRKAGSVVDFAYSAAMKKANVVWTEKALDRFLSAPLKMVPGSTMTYDGVPESQDRADLIAYLKQAAASAECRK